MSTQTGIRANDDLSLFFAKCRQASCRARYRLIKVHIKDEQLVLQQSQEASADWRTDWDRFVPSAVDEDEPCYLLFRLDQLDEVPNNTGLDEKDGPAFRWILISWSPDCASVRSKMLYASTKATLKLEFGGGHIKDDLYGNVREDISLSGFDKHCASAAAPGPLTREEEEREEVRMAQTHVALGVDSKHQTMTNLCFPLSAASIDALHCFKELQADYVQLSIDVKNETIELQRKSSFTVDQLAAQVPDNEPRYHLYRFRHNYEGEDLQSPVFIYTMPGYNCSIKERMLYSSCKNAVVDFIQSLGIGVAKKVEVDSGLELTYDFLVDEIHPKKSLSRAQFARPAPPNRSGNRRITKAPVQTAVPH